MWRVHWNFFEPRRWGVTPAGYQIGAFYARALFLLSWKRTALMDNALGHFDVLVYCEMQALVAPVMR